jgi:D-alanine-D-alanine ligase
MLKGELLDRTAEYDSPQTISTLRDAIAARGDEVVLIEADLDAYERLRTGGIDFVFNIAEGLRGEDREAQIPAILEMLGIPYTGSGPLTLAICLHKAKTKEILSCYDIPTPSFQVVTKPCEPLADGLHYPLIVKLLHEGSSMGLSYASVVDSSQKLAERVAYLTSTYAQPVLVEQFIDGREFTVPVLGNTPPCALPVIEVLFKGPRNITLFQPDDSVIVMIARQRGHRLPDPPVYRYSPDQTHILMQTLEGKELAIPISLTRSICPAPISSDLTAALQQTAVRAYQALECRDWGRIDMRTGTDGIPQVLELNPIAGIDPTYWLPRSALAAGMDYTTLIHTILDAARQRYSA